MCPCDECDGKHDSYCTPGSTMCPGPGPGPGIYSRYRFRLPVVLDLRGPTEGGEGAIGRRGGARVRARASLWNSVLTGGSRSLDFNGPLLLGLIIRFRIEVLAVMLAGPFLWIPRESFTSPGDPRDQEWLSEYSA